MMDILIEPTWPNMSSFLKNKRERISYINPDIRFVAPRSTCELLEIIITEKHMFLLMVNYADSMYKNGGWVQIYPEIFVRESFTENKWPLKRAIGIPVHPDKYEYTADGQCIEFTLVFDRLPNEVSSFDLIEREPSDDSFFNFYGIKFNSNEQNYFE